MEIRVGQGIDVHPFSSDRELILGGVAVPYPRGLDGHSDADVLTHSVIDALLGAAGKGDIGTYFPNDNLRWKNARSMNLLELAWSEIKAEGWALGNLDITLLAEAPKIKPYVSSIKQELSAILGAEIDKIALKATTTEKLGFVGREEGIMSFAVALLIKEP